jgi:2-dehydro-3-deoxygalactonokinase
MTIAPDWIAVDWGTTQCRAWAMSADGEVLAEARSDRGMGNLAPGAFEGALRDLIAAWTWAERPVVACGMVGARQGWVEADYASVPCSPDALTVVTAPVSTSGLRVKILGGVKQDRPADVMRGEETQIAGYLATDPGFDGVLCLPGTHTKWAQISAGEIVSFRTAMTGELFALLAERSVLRHSVTDGWNAQAFADAVADAMSRPEALAARLFSIRAEGLLHDLDGGAARARLSGLLIGAELADMRPYWLGRNVVIVGTHGLAGRYSDALAAQGVAVKIADGDAMTRAGLAHARARLEHPE